MAKHETVVHPKTAPERARARRIFDKLNAAYPDAKCDLNFETPFQLLVATILSAQCLDATVNKATRGLFADYPDAASMAGASIADIEAHVKSCGFYRNKAKNILATAEMIVSELGGDVPDDMERLLSLPGVARKTGNVVLGNAFDINHGVTVDTHVGRISHRLGFTDADPKNAVAVEKDLAGLFPRKTWCHLSHLMIWHGRAICRSQNPRCGDCLLKRSCPKVGVGASD